jgi:hypothetical protein
MLPSDGPLRTRRAHLHGARQRTIRTSPMAKSHPSRPRLHPLRRRRASQAQASIPVRVPTASFVPAPSSLNPLASLEPVQGILSHKFLTLHLHDPSLAHLFPPRERSSYQGSSHYRSISAVHSRISFYQDRSGRRTHSRLRIGVFLPWGAPGTTTGLSEC